MNHSRIYSCPITGDKEYVKYFDLGNIPLVNNLKNTREESLCAEKFPLNINYYPKSGESSLDFSVNPELLFLNYLFKSEINKPYVKHCEDMFEFISDYIKIKDGTKFVDIGGNDGTLLNTFKIHSKKNIDVLNIDPCKNLSIISIDKGIPVDNSFFNYDVALKYKNSIDVVTSTNVFQHLKNINSFVKGIECMLKENGIWILEFPYWIHDMRTNQFDQIYHEHIYYHSVKPIKMMMEKHRLKLINVTKQNIHGGTLRLVIVKENFKQKPDITVEAYLQLEKNYDLEYHIKWGKEIKNHIEDSYNFIKNLKKDNKIIFGFGAAAKGCVYLNSMCITYEDIDYIIDDTDIKQGKFIPGTGIEVVNRNILDSKKPDFILILAHNFVDHIIESLKNQYDGKFIILIPKIQIL